MAATHLRDVADGGRPRGHWAATVRYPLEGAGGTVIIFNDRRRVSADRHRPPRMWPRGALRAVERPAPEMREIFFKRRDGVRGIIHQQGNMVLAERVRACAVK